MRYFNFFIILFVLISCKSNHTNETDNNINKFVDINIVEEIISEVLKDSLEITKKELSTLEKNIIAKGLINVLDLDSSFIIDLRYATTNNFTNQILYDSLENIYLQPEVAERLVKAHSKLKKSYPHLRMLLFDGLRPLSIQQKLWDDLDMPYEQKIKYVADPEKGSLHNYGTAIDLSLYNLEKQEEVDMGTHYDYFGVLAYPVREQELLEQGKLTQKQVDNRLILRNIMIETGFQTITSEWWHFNAHSLKVAKEKYGIVE